MSILILELIKLWITLYKNNKTVTYFDFFGIEHFPKEIKEFTNNKDIVANIYGVQNYDSIMCGYSCIGFICISIICLWVKA